MVYSYQKNSYLTEVSCKVLACEAVKDGRFEITLDDTVLFPEGGGQPDDRGKIGDIVIDRVTRRGATAVHHSAACLDEGAAVKCRVDWQRRFDHMQQHSAQHLMSALADKDYGFKTTSWDLGKSVCHIEMNTPQISADQLQCLEDKANERIREHRPVVVHFLTKDEAQDVDEVKSRGLPGDHIGAVRIIEIEGVEKNMCCGTHVNNLCELQVIKLLHTESMRGGTRLFFIAGDRVLERMEFCVGNERKLTKLLSSGPEDHAMAVEKIVKSNKSSIKMCKSYLKEIACFEAAAVKQTMVAQHYLCHHREDGDADYINTFLKELNSDSEGVLVCVSVGEKKTGGPFILMGSEAQIGTLATRACELLGGKGGGKKGRYQGKATSFTKLKYVHKLVAETAVENS